MHPQKKLCKCRLTVLTRTSVQVDETVTALRSRYGGALLLHFEDFASRNSFRLLARYRAQVRWYLNLSWRPV